LKYCVKNTVQLCHCYHEFHFFFTNKWSVCHLVFGCSHHRPMHFATAIALHTLLSLRFCSTADTLSR
jgi:hypothetical protein